jgi:hypothetical protein
MSLLLERLDDQRTRERPSENVNQLRIAFQQVRLVRPGTPLPKKGSCFAVTRI